MNASDCEESFLSLIAFKKAIADVKHPTHDDIALKKWLVARKYNVKKAEEMYRQSMEWRQLNNVDSLLGNYEPKDVLKKYYATGQCGKDKQGRPLYIDSIGKIDVKGLLHCVERREVIKFIIHKLEVLDEIFRKSRDTDCRVDQCVQIIDCDSLGSGLFWKPALDLFVEIVAILSNNYPESLGKSYIVNIAKIVDTAFGMFTRFIDKGTAEKFDFISGNNWRDTIVQNFNPEDLPKHYGGTLTSSDGDPMCSLEISYGGKVPEDLYATELNETLFPEDETITTTIRNQASVIKTFPLKENQILRYKFKTQHAIKFQISRQDNNKKETIVEPLMLTNSDLVPYQGALTTPAAESKYIFEFNNKASWLTNCSLKYLITTEDISTTL